MSKQRDAQSTYYINLVVYYDEGRYPSPAALARILQILTRLPNLKGRMHLFYSYSGEKYVLGRFPGFTHVTEQLKDAEHDYAISIEASLSRVRNRPLNTITNYDLYLSAAPSYPHYAGGVHPLILSISSNLYDSIGRESYSQLLRHMLLELCKCQPIYGFVDVSSPKDTNGGICYGASWNCDAPLWRLIENNNWQLSGAMKRNKLRSIYWGNLISDIALQGMGGIAWLEKHCDDNFSDSQGRKVICHYRLQSSYIFITLSESPGQCNPYRDIPIDVIESATKLQTLFGKHGLLNLW